MSKTMSRILITLMIPLIPACTEEPVSRPPAPRPVSVVVLETTDPSRQLRLTGSAEAWRKEEIAFQVGGRVEYIAEIGSEVVSPWLLEEGEKIESDVIARLDKARYVAALASAEAALASARADRDALTAEIDHVLPANLDQAKAKKRLAEAEAERYRTAAATNAVSKSDLDAKEAQVDLSAADVAKAQADFQVKQAQARSLDAQIVKLTEDVKQARLDLEDCELKAPFPAVVAAVHAVPGSVVSAGEAVMTLVIMDPMKVVVSVSPKVDRGLHMGDRVNVFPPGLGGLPREGSIFYKDTIADTRTRTFTVEILTANSKVAEALPDDPETAKLHRVSRLWPLITRADLRNLETLSGRKPGSDTGGPVFIERSALHADGAGGWIVWHATNLKRDQSRARQSPVIELKKIPVKLGSRSGMVLELYDFQEIERPEGLGLNDLFATEVPEGFEDGGKVLFARENWLLRPGDLVSVELAIQGPPPGHYVPMKAVLQQGDRHFVFVVVKDGEATKAEKTEVTISANVGELVRIEASGLADGKQVVLQGAHYLVDGERVRVGEEVKVTP